MTLELVGWVIWSLGVLVYFYAATAWLTNVVLALVPGGDEVPPLNVPAGLALALLIPGALTVVTAVLT